MAGGTGDSSSNEAMVASASSSSPLMALSSRVTRSTPFLSLVPSESTTANQSKLFSQFFREVGITPPEATGGSTAMRDVLVNSLVGIHPQPSDL